ncbi:MAG: hypothetical protein IPJ89_03785 [Candidatus Iainarchaeum archaeon]|uniref:Uncharacterized protein n=1 Tax=Candidatus Iainarchaeum sp. TaxID=3101447 RepID=A0A7T9DJ22_9ARCH|nr:MAG: hypothetical protein IPJ89_03785 [Candidatus Diapherotrites archaeon]
MDEKQMAIALVGGAAVITLMAFFLIQGFVNQPVQPPITIPTQPTIPPVTPPPIIPPTTPPTDVRTGLVDTTVTTTPAGPACPSSTQRNVPAYVGSGVAMSLAAQDGITQCQSARTACETQNNIPCTTAYCQSITTISSTQKRQCIYNTTQSGFVVGANGIPTQLGSGMCTDIETANTVSVRVSAATQPDGWTCGATLKTGN